MRLFIMLTVLAAAGCTTTIEVKKLSPTNSDSEPGVRFALPARFVSVSPKPDGTVDVSYAYLPDDKNRFAITSESLMAKNTLSVTVASGLLQGVAFKPNSGEVPAQLATSYGNVRADQVAVDQTSVTTKENDRKTLDKEIRTAQLAFDQATANLALAKKALSGQPEKLLPYEVAEATAKSKLDDLNSQKALLGASNEAQGVSFENNATKPRRAYGPLLFRIAEDYTDPQNPRIALVPVGPQRSFRVLATKVAPAPSGDAPVSTEPCLNFSAVVEQLRFSSDRAKVVSLVFAVNVPYTSATVENADIPSAGTLNIASDGTVIHRDPDGKATSTDGLPAKPGDAFTIVVKRIQNGHACDVEGTKTITSS